MSSGQASVVMTATIHESPVADIWRPMGLELFRQGRSFLYRSFYLLETAEHLASFVCHCLRNSFSSIGENADWVIGVKHEDQALHLDAVVFGCECLDHL